MNDKAKMVHRGEHHLDGMDGLRAFGCVAIVAWHVLANGNFQLGRYLVDTDYINTNCTKVDWFYHGSD